MASGVVHGYDVYEASTLSLKLWCLTPKLVGTLVYLNIKTGCPVYKEKQNLPFFNMLLS